MVNCGKGKCGCAKCKSEVKLTDGEANQLVDHLPIRLNAAGEYVVNPAVSEAQTRYLNAKFGHAWVKEHGFDNHGELPEKVENVWSDAARKAALAARRLSKEASDVSESLGNQMDADLHEDRGDEPSSFAHPAHAGLKESAAAIRVGREGDPKLAKEYHLSAAMSHEDAAEGHEGYAGGDSQHEMASKLNLRAAAAHRAAAKHYGRMTTENATMRCPGCGKELTSEEVEDEQCDRCGEELATNANPEGHNQYSGKGGSARSASTEAKSASKKAEESGSKEDHSLAGQLHEDAAMMHGANGNYETASKHQQKAVYHMRKAGLIGNVGGRNDGLDKLHRVKGAVEDGESDSHDPDVMEDEDDEVLGECDEDETLNANPEGHNQYGRASGASQTAMQASDAAGKGTKAHAKALEALDMNRIGKAPSPFRVKEAHLDAARAHDKAGDTKAAEAHRIAAKEWGKMVQNALVSNMEWEPARDARGRFTHKATGGDGTEYTITKMKTPGDEIRGKGPSTHILTFSSQIGGTGKKRKMSALHASLDDAMKDAEKHSKQTRNAKGLPGVAPKTPINHPQTGKFTAPGQAVGAHAAAGHAKRDFADDGATEAAQYKATQGQRVDELGVPVKNEWTDAAREAAMASRKAGSATTHVPGTTSSAQPHADRAGELLDKQGDTRGTSPSTLFHDRMAQSHGAAESAHRGLAAAAAKADDGDKANEHLAAAKLHMEAKMLHTRAGGLATNAVREAFVDGMSVREAWLSLNCGGKGGTRGPCKGKSHGEGATTASSKAAKASRKGDNQAASEAHGKAAEANRSAAKAHRSLARQSDNAAVKKHHSDLAKGFTAQAKDHDDMAASHAGKAADARIASQPSGLERSTPSGIGKVLDLSNGPSPRLSEGEAYKSKGLAGQKVSAIGLGAQRSAAMLQRQKSSAVGLAKQKAAATASKLAYNSQDAADHAEAARLHREATRLTTNAEMQGAHWEAAKLHSQQSNGDQLRIIHNMVVNHVAACQCEQRGDAKRAAAYAAKVDANMATLNCGGRGGTRGRCKGGMATAKAATASQGAMGATKDAHSETGLLGGKLQGSEEGKAAHNVASIEHDKAAGTHDDAQIEHQQHAAAAKNPAVKAYHEAQAKIHSQAAGLHRQISSHHNDQAGQGMVIGNIKSIKRLTHNLKEAADMLTNAQKVDELIRNGLLDPSGRTRAIATLNAKADGSNADVVGGKGKTKQAGGQEDDPGDVEHGQGDNDEEWNNDVNIRKLNLETNAYGDDEEEGAEGDEDEDDEETMNTSEWLSRHRAPAAVRNAVQAMEKQERAHRRKLIQLLTSNAGGRSKERLTASLEAMTTNQLELHAESFAPQQRRRRTNNALAPQFVGAIGGPVNGGSSRSDDGGGDALPLPVMNYASQDGQ